MSNIFEFFSNNVTNLLAVPIFGALFALLFNYILRNLQYQKDHWVNQNELFYKILDEAIELGSDYWCRAGENKIEDNKKASEILSKITYLDAIISTICRDVNKFSSEKINSQLFAVRDALTGDHFQSNTVKADIDRVRKIHSEAAELIILIRKTATEYHESHYIIIDVIKILFGNFFASKITISIFALVMAFEFTYRFACFLKSGIWTWTKLSFIIPKLSIDHFCIKMPDLIGLQSIFNSIYSMSLIEISLSVWIIILVIDYLIKAFLSDLRIRGH